MMAVPRQARLKPEMAKGATKNTIIASEMKTDIISHLSGQSLMSAFHPLRTFGGSLFNARDMKAALLIVGILAVLMGLLWVGQGLGIVDWPASSFMIGERSWVTRGALLAFVGLILIVASRRWN